MFRKGMVHVIRQAFTTLQIPGRVDVIVKTLTTTLLSLFLLLGCSGSYSGSISSLEPPPVKVPNLLTITPLTKTIGIGGSVTLTATDGMAPYAFDLYYGNGTLSVNGTSATYQALTSQGSVVVRVEDSSGNLGYANIEIIDAPVIQPVAKSLAVTNKFPFAVLSGKAPYHFSVVSGDGTTNSTTGEFVAGNTSGLVVIRVTDADGRSADANVTVNPALSFSVKNVYVEKSNT